MLDGRARGSWDEQRSKDGLVTRLAMLLNPEELLLQVRKISGWMVGEIAFDPAIFAF
jgi:hypothetical protein